MAEPTYPDLFLAAHPRYLNPSHTTELVPGTYAVGLVASINITLPETGRMSGYGALTESVVTIPAMLVPEGEPAAEPSISGEKQIGGVELTYDELSGLPGSTEFLSSLHSLILEKYQAANPTP